MNKVKEIITEKIGSTNVKILGFTNRLKEFESFYDKILRDQIPDNYFTNMEDFIGVRVMCVYYSDLEEIENLIEKNFNVVSKKRHNFTERVGDSGYQSDHYVVKLLENSLSLSDKFLHSEMLSVQCEIQVRTALMHAWATVSHDVLYKKIKPDTNFLREMYAISSLFFFADQRFDIYHNFKEQESKININTEFLEQPLTLDSLTQYVEQKFSDRPQSSSSSILEIVKQLQKLGYITMKQIDDSIVRSTSAFIEYEKDNPLPPRFGKKYGGVGVIRISIAITDTQNKKSESFYVRDIEKYRKLLGEEN